MEHDGRYGNSKPAYSLYQGDDGKWGLVDKDGTRLPAVFNQIDETRFLDELGSVVTFNPNDGFDLVAWCDPCKNRVNDTFDDDEFAEYPRDNQNADYWEYRNEFRRLMPAESRWLLDCLEESEWRLNVCDETGYLELIEKSLSAYPQLAYAEYLNHLLEPIMHNTKVSEDMKNALLQAKMLLVVNVRLLIEYTAKNG